MKLALRLIAIVSFIVAIVWVVQAGGFEPEPILAFLGGLTTLALSFINDKKETGETLDQRNRRVMLNHVENFWVKGILENSLHGAALLDLGIKEDPTAISYPWAIKRESTNETLPTGKSMLEIFEEIGAGRSLLILGAPGSGKTTMLLELARQLIERARNDETEPIPVVFNLASWTEKLTLADWLAEQLNIVYLVPKKTAPTWVNENKMLLLLDGLDEVKQDSREKCVEAINQFRNKHGLTSLVVCSRIEEYRAINAKLSFEGAITLQPLTSKQVDAYIDIFGNKLAGMRVLLKREKEFMNLIKTPLMLNIMTLAYKDKKPEDLPAANKKNESRKHLLDTYINHMFERSTRGKKYSFLKSHTLYNLNWLAQKMIQNDLNTFQLEIIQPSWLETKEQLNSYKWIVRLIGTLIGVLTFSLGILLTVDWNSVTWTAMLLYGLLGGWIGGMLVHKSAEIQILDKLKLNLIVVRTALMFGAIAGSFGVGFGIIYGLLFGLNFGLLLGLIYGMGLGLLSTLLGIIMLGLGNEQIDETVYPGQRIKRSLYNGFVIGLIFGISSGLMLGSVGWLLVAPNVGQSMGQGSGMVVGLIIWSVFGLFPVFRHYTLRKILLKANLLPRQLIPFLEYAVDLIFLRRVGGSYIFVHRLLMEHFAEMEVEKP